MTDRSRFRRPANLAFAETIGSARAGWVFLGACIDDFSDAWFPEGGGGRNRGSIPGAEWDYPRSVCRRCPVRLECLEDALTFEGDQMQMRHGMFGGKTPEERRQIAATRIAGRNVS